MKRFHVHVAVADLGDSIRFYSSLFGHAPSVHKVDYAKWMLEDPRVNFAISQRGSEAGIDHLGLQVDSDDELAELRARVAAAEAPIADQENADCCYARSNKSWTRDPQGIAWEAFHTMADIPTYGRHTKVEAGAFGATTAASVVAAAKPAGDAACCAPARKVEVVPKAACC